MAVICNSGGHDFKGICNIYIYISVGLQMTQIITNDTPFQNTKDFDMQLSMEIDYNSKKFYFAILIHPISESSSM